MDATHFAAQAADTFTTKTGLCAAVEAVGHRVGAVVELVVDERANRRTFYIYAAKPATAAAAKRGMLALLRTLPVFGIDHMGRPGDRSQQRNGLPALAIRFYPSQELAS